MINGIRRRYKDRWDQEKVEGIDEIRRRLKDRWDQENVKG